MFFKVKTLCFFIILFVSVITWSINVTNDVDGEELIKNAKEYSESVNFKAKRKTYFPDTTRTDKPDTYFIDYIRVNSDGSKYERRELYIDNNLYSYDVNGAQGRFRVEEGIAIKSNFSLKNTDLMAEVELKTIPPVKYERDDKPYQIEAEILDEDSYAFNGKTFTRAELGDERFEKGVENIKSIQRIKADRILRLQKQEENELNRAQWFGSIELINESGIDYYIVKEEKSPYRKLPALYEYKIGKGDNFIYITKSYDPDTGKLNYSKTYTEVEFSPNLPDSLFIPDASRILVANTEKEYNKICYENLVKRSPETSVSKTTIISRYINILVIASLVVFVFLCTITTIKFIKNRRRL